MPLMTGAEAWTHDGGPVGVLVIHGFTGSPISMRPWAEHLAAEGFTVALPRLPGHGTTWKDMSVTRWDDWYAEVDRALSSLRESCETVFVMGLSMGGSLTLRLAEKRPGDIAGIVLVNPAVHTERKDAFLLPLLRHIVPAFPGVRNDIKKPGQDEGAYDKMPLQCVYSLQSAWKVIKADIVTDQAERAKLYEQAQVLYHEDIPGIVLADVKGFGKRKRESAFVRPSKYGSHTSSASGLSP